MIKRKKLLLTTLCLPLLFSCQSTPNYEWITISSTYNYIQTTSNTIVLPFNTVMTLKYFKDYDNKTYSDNFDNDLTNLYVNNVVSLHKKLDRHHNYYDVDGTTIVTNVKTINDSYGTGEEILCSDELYKLLKLGHQLTLDTDGAFNFYLGGLTSYWDYVLEEVSYDLSSYEIHDPLYSESSRAIINSFLESNVTLDEIENIMTFNDDKKSVIFNSIPDKDGYDRSTNTSPYRPLITSGGIAKGYATDILKEVLQQNNYYEGYLNSGSSSITSLSDLTFTEKGYQNIGIVDPRSGGGFIRTAAFSLKLVNEYSLSTSANYTSDRSYKIIDPNTNKYIYRHHIINPVTCEPSVHHASVTVISNTFSNGQLDALSTAFVNLPLDEAVEYKKELLSLYPNHDLDLIFMDLDKNNEDKLIITISSDHITKQDIKIEAKDCVVNYVK